MDRRHANIPTRRSGIRGQHVLTAPQRLHDAPPVVAPGWATEVLPCPFCPPLVEHRMEVVHGSVGALKDAYPVTDSHYLVVPLRHVVDYFAMDAVERRDADELLNRLRKEIQTADSDVRGFNIGMNCGPVAGQTVEHAHIHLIPRRYGDTPKPRGGVRGVIPERMDY